MQVFRRFTSALPAVWRAPVTTSALRPLTTVTSSRGDLAPSLIEGKMTSAIFVVADKAGSLSSVLALFEKHGLNLSSIISRPSKTIPMHYEFVVDFEGRSGDPHVDECMSALKEICIGVRERLPVEVPWFPTRLRDLNHMSHKTLDGGAELDSDHPGFSDTVYRERRREITSLALDYKIGEGDIPRVEYTDTERQTWATCYDTLMEYTKLYAVKEYGHVIQSLEANIPFGREVVPQLQDLSDFLTDTTGFRLKPVGGLLSARDFLNGLAFRVFHSTQYLRHHSVPLYTPEPDLVHEALGHIPMFADPSFAAFSQEVGLASLGASDEDIQKLASVYWFANEFGLCMQNGERKAYGAGLLSSFGELEFSCKPTRPGGERDDFPEYKPWEPAEAAVQEYPITTYQPVYFVADSLLDAAEKTKQFCDQVINRPFNVLYDPYTLSVQVDRAVNRGAYRVTLQK